MQDASERTGLDEAISDALTSGTAEIARLTELSERVIDAYAVSTLNPDGVDALLDDFAAAKDDFASRLRSHLSEQRGVLSTFNVAFFGRTGAGKSTLLSAFGQLDGSGVSPGDSDWTTTVESVIWRGCRLYDTPGINGWGGRKSRAELEATARRAVEISDVVLLCFDSQSQQATEFAKVADWVRHYGKPTVAVLNIRNLRWRHPDKVPNETARQNISEPVRQHSDNIRTELAGIGLPDTPVVAIHSRRALFARATTPYNGPAERDFANDREQYGVDYLARWSNFGVLEALLRAGITAGGAQMRLTALREGTRAILLDEANALDSLTGRMTERIDELDRAVSRHLEVLGYLESDERAAHLHDDQWRGDLLTLAETARGAPYLSPADGAFSRYVRTLLKPQLSVPRSGALRRFKALEHSAFEEGKNIDEETFAQTVFDEAEIQAALDEVWTDAAEFLERELSIAISELRHTEESGERDRSDLGGSAGSSASAFEAALRSSGLLVGGAAAVLGAVALTNAWNPAGWVAGVVLAGLGISSQVMGWLGNRKGGEAERERARARAKAAYAGRTAINTTFDRIEKEFATNARTVVWQEASTGIQRLLRELIVVMHLRDEVVNICERVRTEAAAIEEPPVLDPMRDATADLMREIAPDDPNPQVNRILLGEDWFDAAQHPSSVDPVGRRTEFDESCAVRNNADKQQLQIALATAIARPAMSRIADWTQSLADAARQDPIFIDALQAAIPRTTVPSIAVAGDYSAGKSSFIKRLIVEVGGDVPDGLSVRADPTTDEARSYQLSHFNIIDTPGLQSGRQGHDEKAMAGVSGAALVIVVLHVNLLIGDTSLLEGMVKGTASEVGKWPRMLFLINRCDELGVDPHNDVDEYFSRRDRKTAELHAALASRGIEVDPQHIHGVAADPFSAVGRSVTVSREDYDANRDWDGIGSFVECLRSLTPGDIAHANAVAAVDDACSHLLRLARESLAESAEHRSGAARHSSLTKALELCLDDASHLKAKLEHVLSEKVSRHTDEAISKIRDVGVGDDDKLRECAESWVNTDLQADVEQFMKSAADDVETWSSTHSSAINREFAAARFDEQLDISDSADAPNRDKGTDVTEAAGFMAESAQKIASALGNRDAVYWIGKRAGVKFKPWGAVKAGQSVARVGVVLQAAAVAWDAVSWAQTAMKRSDWDKKLDATVEEVEKVSAKRVSELLYGDDGPLRYVDARRSDIRELLDEHRDLEAKAQSLIAEAERRLDVIRTLIQSFEDMRKDAV